MPKRSSNAPEAAFGIGAAVLMVACCAGPALLAGGLLSAVGRVAGNPLVIGAGVLIAVAGVVAVLTRRARGGQYCCPPKSVPTERTSRERDPIR